MTTAEGQTLRRAVALAEVGRHRDAAALLAPHLAANPADTTGWCLLAQCRNALGDPAGALDAADQALRGDVTEEHAWRLRALVLVKLHRHQEAVAAAAEAVRLAPGSWATHSMYAHTLSYVPGGLPHAYTAAVHSTTLAPQQPEAHFRVGIVAHESGHRGIAERAYRTALSLDPQHALARNNLGVLKLHGRRPGRAFTAAEDFAASLAADPQSATARRNVEAVAVLLLGRARWLALLCVWLATVFAGAAGVGQGDPPRPGALLPRLAGIAVMTALWGWWAWRTHRRLPRRLRGPMRALVRRSRAVGVMAAGLAVADLALVPVLAVPWRNTVVPTVTLVVPAWLVILLTSWTGTLLARRSAAGPG